MGIHGEVGDLGGDVERAADFLEGEVEGNVDEVLVVGGEGAGEVDERIEAERRVERAAACSGHGLRRPPVLQFGVGFVLYDDGHGGGGGGDDH